MPTTGTPLAVDFCRGNLRLLRGTSLEAQEFELPPTFSHAEVLSILRDHVDGASWLCWVGWHIPVNNLDSSERCWNGLDREELAAGLGIPVYSVTDVAAVARHITLAGLNGKLPFGLMLVNNDSVSGNSGLRSYVANPSGETTELTVVVPEGHIESDFVKWVPPVTHIPRRLIARANGLRRRNMVGGHAVRHVFVWSEDELQKPQRAEDCLLEPLGDGEAPCTVHFLGDRHAHLLGAMHFTNNS